MKKSAGFSLIELMITIVIIAIVTSIAIPSYREHVKRTKRSDATAALLRLAAEQEKFYIANNTYTDDIADLNIDGTDEGLYTISFANTNLVVTYTATATAKSGESQADDDACRSFSIDANGSRTATDSTTTDNTDYCWK
ncbi:MAG: type IV pilin protein [Gammaproteobacteria bacterium]